MSATKFSHQVLPRMNLQNKQLKSVLYLPALILFSNNPINFS